MCIEIKGSEMPAFELSLFNPLDNQHLLHSSLYASYQTNRFFSYGKKTLKCVLCIDYLCSTVVIIPRYTSVEEVCFIFA